MREECSNGVRGKYCHDYHGSTDRTWCRYSKVIHENEELRKKVEELEIDCSLVRIREAREKIFELTALLKRMAGTLENVSRYADSCDVTSTSEADEVTEAKSLLEEIKIGGYCIKCFHTPCDCEKL